MSVPASAPSPGDILAGKYRVERVIGTGGMGVVVAAHHIGLDTRVAVKLLRAEALQSTEAIARFIREARAAARLKSIHVTSVTDVSTLESGAPYIVMEYLEGRDLQAWLAADGPLPVEQAVEFVLQASVAVAEAHSVGIVHRDLKPANLFCIRRLDGEFSIKVLDFGISKQADDPRTGGVLTKTYSVMGSPVYMSPEHLRSARATDARTDIWALGVVLFELVAGRPPFEAKSLAELGRKIATEEPAAIASPHGPVPQGLALTIQTCLEKDADRRYQSVLDLAVALLPFAPPSGKVHVDCISGVVRAARERAPSGVPSAPVEPQSPSVVVATMGTASEVSTTMEGTTAHWTHGLRRGWALAGVCASVALLVALLVAFR